MSAMQASLLITDDDRNFREAIGELLTRRGFHTTLAEDGQEAVEILQSHSVHLVMMDLHMPRLGGLDALATIRRMEIDIPFILMSAKLDDDVVKQASKLDAQSVLEKPFTSRILTKTICDVLLHRYGFDLHHRFGLDDRSWN